MDLPFELLLLLEERVLEDLPFELRLLLEERVLEDLPFELRLLPEERVLLVVPLLELFLLLPDVLDPPILFVFDF